MLPDTLIRPFARLPATFDGVPCSVKIYSNSSNEVIMHIELKEPSEYKRGKVLAELTSAVFRRMK